MRKKITKKKVTRRKNVKKAVVKNTTRKNSQSLVITVQPPPAVTPETLAPIQENSKYVLPRTWISDKQIIKLVQRTPQAHIYSRPAKGGGKWLYVTGSYVEKVLNFVFGWNWDFEVVSHGTEGGQVWVLGKLTVKDDKGHSIAKTQFGRADIKFRKGSKEMLDFGNDLKAAATDSLKKCASMFGIAGDVYGKTEFKQETGQDIHESTPTKDTAQGQVVGPEGSPVFICSQCDQVVDEQVATFSKRVFGKILCREDQVNAKKK